LNAQLIVLAVLAFLIGGGGFIVNKFAKNSDKEIIIK